MIGTRDKARSSLVLALKARGHVDVDAAAGGVSRERETSIDRLPLPTSTNLDQALDDVIARFPETLSYLAK